MFSSGGHTPRGRPTLEIIPETKFVVFHGDEHNAQPFKLTGVVRLTTPESMGIKAVKIRLEGKRRIGWFYMGGMAAGEVSDKRTFLNECLNLGTSGTHKINKGVIEWPFEFTMNPSLPESVEGMASTWLVYNLHASVERPGWNAKDLITSTHIRLVRTLGLDQNEMSHSRTNADVWANKLSYSISIPSDSVVFGTSITADVELSPIRKGVRLGKVDMRLVEHTTKRISAQEVPDLRNDRTKSEEHEVAKADMEFPEESRVTFEDETPENPMMEDERYRFKAKLPLPKTLKECRQDVDSHAINITHRFKLMVNIHNPEGHTSQLVCRLPVKLFISPNLPIDESNVVQTGTHLSDAELNNQEAAQTAAPPEYGRHQLDELYSDIQPSGFMSGAPSGSATPYFGMSRRGSSENLQNLNALASAPDGTFSSAALQARLQSLENYGHPPNQHGRGPSNHHSPSGGGTPHNGFDHELPVRPTPPSQPSGYFTSATHYSNRSSPPHHSPDLSNSHSRRPSDDLTPDESGPSDYDLSRVPSYGAAVRTPGPIAPFTAAPPSYMEATSRPPSPPSLLLRRPSQAHLRSRSGQHSPTAQTHNAPPLSAPSGLQSLMSIPGSPNVPQGSFASGDQRHRGSITAEDDARLRMMRAKAH